MAARAFIDFQRGVRREQLEANPQTMREGWRSPHSGVRFSLDISEQTDPQGGWGLDLLPSDARPAPE